MCFCSILGLLRAHDLSRRLRALQSEQQLSEATPSSEEGGPGPATSVDTPHSTNYDENGFLFFPSTPRTTFLNCDLPTDDLNASSSSILDQLPSNSPRASPSLEVLDPGVDFDIGDSTTINPRLMDENILSDEQELQLYLQPIARELLPKEKIISEVTFFFSWTYVVYPIIHPRTLIGQLNGDIHLSNTEFHSLLLSVALINEAYKVRRSPQHDPFMMNFLVKAIEGLRTGPDYCHFSEQPSFDSVVVSLFLFIAYNVSGRHNRAFFYLTEAIGLFDLVQPSSLIETIRLQRLEYVLYITESATVSIYGSGRKRMLSSRPSNIPDSSDLLLWDSRDIDIEQSVGASIKIRSATIDKQAVDLLLLMTRLHLAPDVTQVAKISVDDRLMHSVTGPFDDDLDVQNTRYATLAADVAITRQWKLAELWWKNILCQSSSASPKAAVDGTIEMIAITTLTWSKTLEPGHLRIVGPGKLVALTDSITNISSRLGSINTCTYLIRSLIQTVAETDYERYFAPKLSMTEISIGAIPRLLEQTYESGRFEEANAKS